MLEFNFYLQPKSATRKKRMTTEKSMIKTGNRAVDDHCRPSTLTKETAEMVDKFRQLKLKEYNEVVRLCKENDMALNIQLFEKGNFKTVIIIICDSQGITVFHYLPV